MQGGQDGEAKSWSSKAIRGIRGHHRYQRSSEVSEVILGIRGPPRPSEAIIRGDHQPAFISQHGRAHCFRVVSRRAWSSGRPSRMLSRMVPRTMKGLAST